MGTASITYNGYAFSATGRPWLARKEAFEAETTGAGPRRKRVTVSIQQIFTEPSYADNQARYTAMRTALTVRQGVLVVLDENGTELINTVAHIEDLDLPAEWGQYRQETTISFSFFELVGDVAAQGGLTATFTPTGGGPFTLTGISDVKEDIRIERVDAIVTNRAQTFSSVVLQGKIFADPNLPDDTRKAFLQGKEGSIKALADTKDGTLVFGGLTKLGWIASIGTNIREDLGFVEWTVSFSYRRFPGQAYAEAVYNFSTSVDYARLVVTTSVRGTVKANTTAAAKDRTDAIKALYGAGKVLQREDADDKEAWGADSGTSATWIERNFSFEFTAPLDPAGQSWNITITTKENTAEGTNTITYAGSVRSKNSADAVAKARALGSGKFPIRVSSSEALASAANNNGPEVFSECTFSYEYTVKGTWIAASITNEVQSDGFSTWSQTVAGSVTAADLPTAQGIARGYKLSGLLVRSERETNGTTRVDASTLFTKLDFAYSYQVIRTDGAIRYSSKTARDYRARRKTTTYSGEAWAQNAAAADDLINVVLNVSGLGHITGDERESRFDSRGAITAFQSRTFTATYEDTFAAGGDDIVEASWTVRSTYSVNKTIITEIPFGTPFVQEATGLTPGARVSTGSITVLTLSTGTDWARSKAIAGGFPAPYQEDVETQYVPFGNTNIQGYRVSFTHTNNFAVLNLGD